MWALRPQRVTGTRVLSAEAFLSECQPGLDSSDAVQWCAGCLLQSEVFIRVVRSPPTDKISR